MNHFSEELERQLAEKKMSQVDLANATKISQSQISKWIRGDQTSINEEQLTKIARALSCKAPDHALLVRAHLLDEKFGPGANLVRVEMDATFEKQKFKSRGDKAMHFLDELRKTDRHTNNLIITTAQCLGAEI